MVNVTAFKMVANEPIVMLFGKQLHAAVRTESMRLSDQMLMN